MRIISQDGKCDYPYENSTLFIDYMDGRVIKIVPSTGGYKGSNIATYSTKEKALKAMEMLRDAYNNNEFYHHTATTDDFKDAMSLLSNEKFKEETSEYFQFPQDDEIEV